jgi:short subunit dehydrogenase-like uncharacterized protein
MSYNLLLYGATGFSGRLIAAEGKQRGMSRHEPKGDCRMILAARDARALERIAKENGMEFRIFALNDPEVIRRNLDGIDVLINAAGPFASTAQALVRAALEAGCHYVDINGEIDVYRKLDDLALKAARRGIALVSGAGATAAASDVLLDAALTELKSPRLGAIRIGMSQLVDFSRGTVATAVRSLREQVAVVRTGKSDKMVVCHEPVGRLERTFDFGPWPGKQKERDLRITSAVGVIDTLTAKHTAERFGRTVHAIESYMQMGAVGRFAYQIGGMLSSLSAVPALRAFAGAQLQLLPEGLTPQELKDYRHVTVLEIEDIYRTRVLDWRIETPNVYDLTAELVVKIGEAVARQPGGSKVGWVTPADALGLGPAAIQGDTLLGYSLNRRRG